MARKQRGPGSSRRSAEPGLNYSTPADRSGSANTTSDSRAQLRSGGWRSIGEISAKVVADIRFSRDVERLHQLGPRVLSELLREIGRERRITTEIERMVAEYSALDPEAVRLAGTDRFSAMPHRVVPK